MNDADALAEISHLVLQLAETKGALDLAAHLLIGNAATIDRLENQIACMTADAEKHGLVWVERESCDCKALVPELLELAQRDGDGNN